MKFTLVLLIVATFIGCGLSSGCTDDSWAEFKLSFKKSYADPSEDRRHYDIFCEKVKMINEHNAKYEKGETTFKMGVNKFADMSAKEMSNWLR